MSGDIKNTVSVVVRIRPQSVRERAENALRCISITPGEPQIVIGPDRAFTYDNVFGEQSRQTEIYKACVHGLLEGIFDGFNATVLAYGQTGSGKTYTMGTNFDSILLRDEDDQLAGIIPRAAIHLFKGIEQRKKSARAADKMEPSFEVSVQFIELYNEDIIDLLVDERSGQRNVGIKIQEDPVRSEISLRGAVWQKVGDAQEVMEALKAGALNRTTAATNMNQQSSRSHAIFTMHVKQNRMVDIDSESKEQQEGLSDDPLTELMVVHAKFHFVDLAGSERLKRTGATGDRAKEGISINSGLLALGNVISALGGGGGKISHVPYRDSKLTRLLQDSLGGNSRTLMIACASPCDVDFIETLSTLNYANRAKNIKNKVVANRDKSSKIITELRIQNAQLKGRIAQLEAELAAYQQGNKRRLSPPIEEYDEVDENLQPVEEEDDGPLENMGDDNCSDLDDEEEEEDAEGGDENPEEKHSQEHARLCDEMAKLQEDIDVKERLVSELEKSQRKLDQLRRDYERKLAELAQRFKETEAEREKVIEEMAAKKPTQKMKDEIAKIREQYEKELTSMRTERRRLEIAERENKKMQAQQSKQLSEISRIKTDLENMKRQKVDLMKRLKEENKKMREIQTATAKKMATYEKLSRQQQNKIQKLEYETALKTQNLKRKDEEVKRLKEIQARRQTIFEVNREDKKSRRAAASANRAGGVPSETEFNEMPAADLNTTFVVSKTPRADVQIPMLNFDEEGAELADATPKQRRPRRDSKGWMHTPAHVRRRWSVMERAINFLILKKNAISKEEEGMCRLMRERNSLQEEMMRLTVNYSCSTDCAERANILELQAVTQAKLDYVQEEIQRLQKSIVDLDENVLQCNIPSLTAAGMDLEQQAPVVDLESLMVRLTAEFPLPNQIQYIIRNLIEGAVYNGVQITKLQTENKELAALLGMNNNEDVREVVEATIANAEGQKRQMTPGTSDPILALQNSTFIATPGPVKQSTVVKSKDGLPKLPFDLPNFGNISPISHHQDP